MKAKALIIGAITLAMFGHHAVNAQDFGDDPDKCRMQLSTYTEFHKQNNFKDALPAWRWAFNNCPASTKNIYIHGTDIIEYFIENAEDKAVKEKYIDTLMMVYDRRIEHFGQKGAVLGRKAVKLIKHRPHAYEEAYGYFEEAFEIKGDKSSDFILANHLRVSAIMFQAKKIDSKKMVEDYAKIIDVIESHVEAATGSKSAKLESMKEQLDKIFANTGSADCETLINLFTPKFEENPDDIELAKKIQALLKRSDCEESELYAKVSEVLYKNEKTANAAHSLAQYFFKNDQAEKAVSYYKEAIELQEEPEALATLYYELGLLYFSKLDQFTTARSFAQKAVNENSKYGKAYILMGKIYAASASNCGENSFEHKAVYWAAVDKFVRARSVDSSVTDEANELIGKYTAYFPKKDDAFFYGVTEGKEYKINCWINETTIARFNE